MFCLNYQQTCPAQKLHADLLPKPNQAIELVTMEVTNQHCLLYILVWVCSCVSL